MKHLVLTAAIAVLATPALSACTSTGSMDKDPVAMRVGDIHFPTRKVNNLQDSILSTMRGDLIQMDNCLYLTNIQGKPATRRYAVSWPSNSVIEREQTRSKNTKLVVVSRAALFNDQTRSVVTVPSRIEVLGQLVDEPFNGNSSMLKNTNVSGCKASGTARIRTFREVEASRSQSMQ